jgi:hypothetical protein
MTRRGILRLCAALVAVLLTSCGSDAAPRSSELVAASLLRLSDLPDSEDWKIDDSTDPESEKMDKDLDECDRKTNPTAGIGTREKDSHTFSRSDLNSAQSTGSVVRSQAKRDAFFHSIGDQLTCAGSVLSAFMQKNLLPGQSVEVGAPYRLDVENKADRTAGWSIQIGIAADATTPRQTLYVDFIVVEQGELLAGYFFFHTGDLTLKEEALVVGKCLDRVKKEHT